MKQYSKYTQRALPGKKKVYITVMRYNRTFQVIENKRNTRINDNTGYYSENIAGIVPFRVAMGSVCVFMRKIRGVFSPFIPLLRTP